MACLVANRSHVESWGDGAATKALGIEVRGPEFRPPQNPHKSQQLENRGGSPQIKLDSLASQKSANFRFSEKPRLNQ